MTAKEQFEMQASEWQRAGRPARLQPSGQRLLALHCWALSEGGKRDGMSPTLKAFKESSEAAQPVSWLEDEIADREACQACGERYRVAGRG